MSSIEDELKKHGVRGRNRNKNFMAGMGGGTGWDPFEKTRKQPSQKDKKAAGSTTGKKPATSACPKCGASKLPRFKVCKACHLGSRTKSGSGRKKTAGRRDYPKAKQDLLTKLGVGDSNEVDKQLTTYGDGIKGANPADRIIEMEMDKPKKDKWAWLRIAKDRPARESLITEMRQEDREKIIKEKVRKLDKKDQMDAVYLMRMIRANPHRGEADVIKEYAELHGRKTIMGEEAVSLDKKYRLLRRLLNDVGWFAKDNRQLPKIYIGSKAALSAMGKELNRELMKLGVRKKERWALIGRFYRERVDGNEIIWRYKTKESYEMGSKMLSRLRLDLIKTGLKDREAEKRVSDFNIVNVRDDPEFNSRMYNYEEIFSILKLRSKKERKERLNKFRNSTFSLTIQGVLKKAAMGAGLPTGKTDRYNKKIYARIFGLPYYSKKAALFGFKNQRKKLIKGFLRDTNGLIKEGLLTRQVAMEKAADYAKRQLSLLRPTMLHYPGAAGTAVYHVVINTKGNILNKQLLPDGSRTTALIRRIAKESVEEKGGLFITAGPDTRTRDHVHLAFELNPDVKASEQVGYIKRRLKEAIKKEMDSVVEWSSGYSFKAGAGEGRLRKLINYILRNEKAGKTKFEAEEIKDVITSDYEGQTRTFLESRQDAYRGQDRTCSGCGESLIGVPYHGDHIIPKVRGGHDGQIQAMCPVCNQKKGVRDDKTFKDRLPLD